MNKVTLRIHAFLTTSTPLHISSGIQGGYDVETGRVSTWKAPGSIPCALVQRMGINGLERVNEDGSFAGAASVPVIMANNVMGRLRRRAAALVLDEVEAKGERIKIGTYNALMCGASTGNPDGADATFDEYRAAHEHPYLGLFGGGPKLFRRRAHGFNAVPYTADSRIMFERCKHPFFNHEVHAVKAGAERYLTRATLLNRNDDLRELVNLSQAAASIEDFAATVTERQNAILSGKKAAKEDAADAAVRTTTRSFTTFEFVVPGVVFPVCFELREVTEAQVGLFLLALDAFARNEELGGQGRNGFGRFTLSDVALTDEDDKEVFAQGLFQESRLQRDNEAAEVYLQAWEQAKQDINASSLNAIFESSR